jgi:hypothetical protein
LGCGSAPKPSERRNAGGMRTEKLYAAGVSFIQRFAFSWVALAIGYGVGFGVERVVRALFLFGSETKATLFWFGVFSLLGWLVFGLPVLVISPWRREFRSVGISGLVGGVVGVVLLTGLAGAFSGGEVWLHARGWELLGIYGGYAFVIGFVATGSYVWLCGKLLREQLP